MLTTRNFVGSFCRIWFLICATAGLTCNQVGDDTEGLNFVVSENEIVYSDIFDNDLINDDVPIRFKRAAFMPFRSEKFMSKQISQILNELLHSSGYDKRIRPQISGPPLDIEVNIAIRSMGPVDEVKQTFAMDCYFRQFWTDDRLRYNNTRFDELAMNYQFITKIWRPDTFFINGKGSYLHKMTVPNRFIRIAPNGRISYSQRLTIKASCQMNLRKFPLDSQSCPLIIGSFGHDAGDVVYRWSKKPLSMDKLELAQYHLVNWNFSDYTKEDIRIGREATNVSIIALEFNFQRRTGFFLLQIYIPLTLIVCCSWVTFWLVKTEKGTEIPARTGLGATTVLSIVTIGFSGKSKPQVNYATALDVFIILCFAIVFAALVEFAMLNFLDTLVRKLKRKESHQQSIKVKMAKSVSNDACNNSGKPLASIASELDDNEAFLEEIVMCEDGVDEEEDEDTFLPLMSTADGIAVIPSITVEDTQWETIETVITNGQDIEKDVGIILGDTVKNLNARFRFQCRLRRRAASRNGRRSESFDDVDESTSCAERFWGGLEVILTKLKCSKFIKSLNMVTVCDRVDEVSRKFFPIMFLLLNLVYWVSYIYIM